MRPTSWRGEEPLFQAGSQPAGKAVSCLYRVLLFFSLTLSTVFSALSNVNGFSWLNRGGIGVGGGGRGMGLGGGGGGKRGLWGGRVCDLDRVVLLCYLYKTWNAVFLHPRYVELVGQGSFFLSGCCWFLVMYSVLGLHLMDIVFCYLRLVLFSNLCYSFCYMIIASWLRFSLLSCFSDASLLNFEQVLALVRLVPFFILQLSYRHFALWVTYGLF